MISVGERAPDFTTKDCQGRAVTLSAIPGRKILFFFPRAFSQGCTVEVNHFKDHQERIRALGAELVGVSTDTFVQQCKFSEDLGIQFALLSDADRRISELYGVLWPVVKVDRRVTFVIDENMVVEEVIRHELRVSRHLDDVLAFLQRRKSA
jgi:thioredoxin-dependent peroxiredoxin